jgi:hypothetical protein
MAKETRTAFELADVIEAEIGGGNVRVVVIPLPVVGWGVKIISAPAEAVNAQAFVDQIASRLRVKFELKP